MPIADLAVHPNGLLIDVSVGPSAALRELAYRKNRTLAPAVFATLLVDTGAYTTMLSSQLMQSLALPARAKSRLYTSTTDASGAECDVHDVSLTLLPHVPQPRSWGVVEVLATPLLNHGIDGLLGRDLLRDLVLTYDGPRAKAVLNY